MPNLRIVRTNDSDIGTLSATEEAGSLVVENLQTDIKTEAWRSTTKFPSITATFSPAIDASMVVLAFSNLSSTATMTVKGYTLVGDGSPAFNTGAVSCCPSGPLSDLDWGVDASGINSVSIGGGVYGAVWFTSASVEKIVIDISDTNNADSYIEAGKLVIGDHWEADCNADYGARLIFDDRSRTIRSDSGNLVTERGTRNKRIAMDLSFMAQADRNQVIDLLVNNGISRPFYISLFPEDADSKLEQSYQLYAKMSEVSPLVNSFYTRDATQLEVQEV